MQIDLQPRASLSHVVFVHDYLQLVFQDVVFTLYNIATYSSGSVELRQGQPGFCDAIVALIGEDVRPEALPSELLLHFTHGAVVSIPTCDPDTRGSEAWQFGRLGGPHVVEQNA